MTHFALWLACVAATILAGIAVPYGLLGGGTPSFDIFWFWCAVGAAIVALIGAGVARWRV